MDTLFVKRLKELQQQFNELSNTNNKKVKESNGVFNRYVDPVLTAGHVPLSWKYDLEVLGFEE